MDKIIKYKKEILIVILLLSGAAAFIFGNKLWIQAGIGCTCWGVAVLVISYITKLRNEDELIKFERSAQEILKDISEKGADSEYYTMYNFQILNNARAKLIKNNKKQFISCLILGVVLLIIAVMCIV